jgi:hypothetical protein
MKDKEINLGAATVIPFKTQDPNALFMYDLVEKKYQFMVAYMKVENELVTKQITKFLPPLLFEHEIIGN